MQNQSSTIWIPNRPNSIVNYDTNPIPSQWLSQQSQWGCNFDLFLIKVDWFWCNLDWKIDLSQLKDRKSQLKDWNYQLNDQNCQFIWKKLIYFNFFDHFRFDSITYWLKTKIIKSINYDIFDIIRTCFNPFRRDE